MSLEEDVKKYKEGTISFLAIADSLTEQQLDSSLDGEWTLRQIIHHVADSEAQSYARLRRLIVEPGTLIQGYDDAWERIKHLDIPSLLSPTLLLSSRR